MASRRNKSDMWDVFMPKKDHGGRLISVSCSLCHKELKYFGNTTNLKERLQRVHPIYIFSRETVQVTRTIVDNSGRGEDVTADIGDPQEISAGNSGKASRHQHLLISTKSRQLKFCAVNAELSLQEKEVIDCALIKMIRTDFHPLSVVENQGF